METDLKKLPKVKRLGLTFTGDDGANKIGVSVTDGGESVTLTGSITANVILANGQTITVAGSKESNKAWIVLPDDAYEVEGAITVAISEVNNGEKTTLAACVGTVRRSMTNVEGGV